MTDPLYFYRTLNPEGAIRKSARHLIRTLRVPIAFSRRASEIARHPLNEQRRVGAVLHYAKMKALQNRTGMPVMLPYLDDAVLIWPKESTSIEGCAKYGLGEFYDMAFCLHVLREGDLFLDVGANSGVYTILASKAVGARTTAIEPVPGTFSILSRNIEANQIGDLVEALQCGAGRTEGRLHFTAGLCSFNHVVDRAGPDTVEVPVLPLDKILMGRVPRVIKMDVEGFEMEALAGASASVSGAELLAVIFEASEALANFGTSAKAIGEWLRERGFTGPHWYDPFARKLIPAGAKVPGRANHIYVRDEAAVAKLAASSRKFTVRGTSF